MSHFILRVFDVEHGACAIMQSPIHARLAMIDSGHNASTDWRPSSYIRHSLQRDSIDHLFITNADQDHMSDLDGLFLAGIRVGAFWRNQRVTPECMRSLKQLQWEVTQDVERYLALDSIFPAQSSLSFNQGMDGISVSTFGNAYPAFRSTNDLSNVVFFTYAGTKFLFPGDLERAGWLALLRNRDFVAELASTDVLMASHHGRENGYCEEAFEICRPRVVVISDKPIRHATQDFVPDYRHIIRGFGVPVTGQARRRHVLTTRRDGDITFEIQSNGRVAISTSRNAPVTWI